MKLKNGYTFFQKYKMMYPKFLFLFWFILITGILYYQRIKIYKLSDFLSGEEQCIDACYISQIGAEPVVLENDRIKEFLALLDRTNFSSNGCYSNIMVGNLYQVHFFQKTDQMEKIILTIVFSDRNIAYIDQKQYTMKNDDGQIFSFFKTLFNE